jgi:hypothetical protein
MPGTWFHRSDNATGFVAGIGIAYGFSRIVASRPPLELEPATTPNLKFLAACAAGSVPTAMALELLSVQLNKNPRYFSFAALVGAGATSGVLLLALPQTYGRQNQIPGSALAVAWFIVCVRAASFMMYDT